MTSGYLAKTYPNFDWNKNYY